MTDPAPRVRIESLLEHAAWVRGLARSLARDDAAADDLEQETWHAAMRSPPATAEHPKAWLRTVMVNLFRERHRTDVRREARESAASRPEATADSTDVVARAEMSQRLVGYVLDLPEPYQRAVLLHFFDSLAPREIAARLGEPLETVRSRIKRGLAKLRERMAKEHGHDWVAALAPLLAWPDPPAGSSADPPLRPVRARRHAWRIVAALAAGGLLAASVVAYRDSHGPVPPSSPVAGRGGSGAAQAPDASMRVGRGTGTEAAEAARDALASPADAARVEVPQASTPTHVTEAVLTISTDDGSDPGRVEVTAIPFAAADRKPEGAAIPLVAASGSLRAELPPVDDAGRRIVEWEFRVDHPEYLRTSRRALVAPLGERGALELALRLDLTRAAHVVGSVEFDPEREGDRASVATLDAEASLWSVFERVQVAPGGRFRLRLPGGRRMAYLAVAPDRTPHGAEVRLAPGEEKDVGVLAPARGERVAGRLTSASGAVCAGHEVEVVVPDRPYNQFSVDRQFVAWGPAGPLRYIAYAKISADGRFSAQGLPAGRVSLTFDRAFAGATSDITRSPDLVFHAPTDAADVAFAGATVRVRVTKSGLPLAGVNVSVSPRIGSGTVVTGDDGTAAMLVKPGATHRVEVTMTKGLRSPVVEVVAGDPGTTRDVALEAFDAVAPTPETTALLSVSFRGAAAGATSGGLALFDASNPDRRSPVHKRVGAATEGGVRFDGLPPGHWRVRVWPGSTWFDPAGWYPPVEVEREFVAGQAIAETLDTTIGGRLVIHTLDRRGEPMRPPVACRLTDATGTRVHVLFAWRDDLSTHVEHSNLSGSGPTEVIDALAPGRYRVECTPRGRNATPLAQDVEIRPEKRTEVVFRFD